MHKRSKLLLSLTLLIALILIGNASFIHAKAQLAQVLLNKAWYETREHATNIKPWPWADTWPVARIQVPRLKIDHIVLAGANGEALAFGPGHLHGTALPGQTGNVLISGHRDTHFAFLEKVQLGDRIMIDTIRSRTVYRVEELLIIDKEIVEYIPMDQSNKLILITCYPFNAIQSGGSLRYLVMAEPEQNKIHNI